MTPESAVNAAKLDTITLLTIVFVNLRWAEVIDWPWMWAFSPLWLGVMYIVVSLTTKFIRDSYREYGK